MSFKETEEYKNIIRAEHAEKRAAQQDRVNQFRKNQQEPYSSKVSRAGNLAWEFYNQMRADGHGTYVAVGGLDSITLLLFLRSIGLTDVPAISVSVLEDKSIQEIHKQLGVKALHPSKSKVNIIKEFGWPVLSKEIANKIDVLQHPTERNKTVRHAICTGVTGEQGGFQTNSRMKLPDKWLRLFAGYENENEGKDWSIAPFSVSSKCCYYLKEKPCNDYSKEHDAYPYMGLMASEGGRREKALMLNGCNYISRTTKRSAPFATFNRQDLLQLALDLNVPVPSIYGEIVRDADGTLRTTRAQRTGCSMCGFGIHLEKRPHRFDLLRETNPKEWDFWMNHVMQDDDGEWYGWGRVLDYIGVEWRPENEDQLDLFGGM